MVLGEMPGVVLEKKTNEDNCLSDTESNNEFKASKADNKAWAEAIGKILVKQGPKSEKTIILVKNKEKFEEDKEERLERREYKKQRNKKRIWEEMNHVKPDPLEKEYERNLQKIATRGVVQLFNAVKNHQAQLDSKLKIARTEGKKEKVMKSICKGEFMDMLKDGSKSVGDKKCAEKGEGDMDEKWDVLRDDYMMQSKLKDWDKSSDHE